MKTFIALALFSFTFALLVPAPASAQTVSDCEALIAALSEETAATTFLNGDQGIKLELQLLGDLSRTASELLQNGHQERQEMKDYEVGVSTGVQKGILSLADGTALLTAADGVIACINSLPK